MIKKIKDWIRKKVFEYQIKRYPFPCKVIVGADGDRYPGWLSTEKSFFDITNIDHWKKYFEMKVPITTADQTKEVPDEMIEWKPMQVIKNLLLDHVLQELDNIEAVTALTWCKKYMAPGGRIRIAVPDWNHRDNDFKELMQQIYPSKMKLTEKNLIHLLRQAGFKQFQVKECFQDSEFFNISTWYRIDGYCKRSFWYDPNNMTGDTGMFWSCLIVDAIKENIDGTPTTKIKRLQDAQRM